MGLTACLAELEQSGARVKMVGNKVHGFVSKGFNSNWLIWRLFDSLGAIDRQNDYFEKR